jgi:hypothetical protein
LLPNNTASGTFLRKSVGMGSVDWAFVIKTRSCRWRSEYVTVDKMFYCLLVKQQPQLPYFRHAV